MLFVYLYLTFFSKTIHFCAGVCIENLTNRFIAASFPENLPVMIQDLVVDVFDQDLSPSCANGEPNVVLPGYAVLSKGKAHVPVRYDLANNAVVKITASSESGTKYCHNGKSLHWFLPHYYCTFELCGFVGEDMCTLLGKPGIHTIEELATEINFNPKLKLPEPPCFLGFFCLTELFGGRYHLEFAVDYKNKTIVRWKVPMDRKYLQLAEDFEDDH